MRTPTVQGLPEALRTSGLHVARTVQHTGQRAWIVGGPVRDLALGRTPGDLDMASALTPERIEALFPRTSAVGKAFGTVLVHVGDVDVQLTTFRRERGYSDARRPDLVEYTERLEEDARRRDFTCNALYLDPLSDEVRDPEHGLDDIAARRLRAVGDPRARFAEDGLRLVRLARFAAALDFEIDPGTLAGARASAAALVGVSPERRLAELEQIFATPRSARALRILADAELLGTLLPGYAELCPDPASLELRARALSAVAAGAPGSALGLAVLLQPDSAARAGRSRALLDFLRPSRELRQRIEKLWRLARELGAPGSRATLVRFARTPEAADALALARAWRTAHGADASDLEALGRAVAELGPEELQPKPLLDSGDLARANVQRGPAWKTLLEQAETEQLDGRLQTREQALAWLADRARELRDAQAAPE